MVIFHLQLDLADLSSVRSFVKNFKESGKDLYSLVNNAGVLLKFSDKIKQFTKDGFELTMGTNHLGKFMFLITVDTMLLFNKNYLVLSILIYDGKTNECLPATHQQPLFIWMD